MLDFEARKRLMCLIIVLLFAVGWPIMSSTYLLFHPSYGTEDNNLSFGFNLITELLGLILLRVALKSQGRSFKELGWTFKFTDIGHAILLYLCFYVLEIVLILFVPHLKSEPENIGFLKSNITLFYFLFIIVNPFFEELIVRAYGITEFLHFFKKEEIAVLASTLIQTSYHLYQGAVPAILNGLLFLFSLFILLKRGVLFRLF